MHWKEVLLRFERAGFIASRLKPEFAHTPERILGLQ